MEIMPAYTPYQPASNHSINVNTTNKNTNGAPGSEEWRRSAQKSRDKAASCASFKGRSGEGRMKELERTGGGAAEGKRLGRSSRRGLKRGGESHPEARKHRIKSSVGPSPEHRVGEP